MGSPETLGHLSSSVGAARLQPGFAWTEALDLQWACGFPDLVYATDTSPKKGPIAWYREREPVGMPCGAWPAEVVHLLVNAADCATRETLSPKPDAARANTDALLAEAEALPPPDEEVLLRVLRKLLGDSYLYFGDHRSARLLYAVEALAGPEWVVSTALEYLESLSPEALNQDSSIRVTTMNSLRATFWRLPASTREAVQARIAALFEVARQGWRFGAFERKPSVAASKYVIATFDAILHGAAAVIGYRQQDPWIAALTQDASFLGGFFTATKGEKWTAVGASAAFVAKDAVLNAYTTAWTEYTQKADQVAMIEALGTIADDRVLPWMMRMAAESRAKAEAKQWFVTNTDIAGDFVRDIAADSSHQYNAWGKKTAKAMKL